MSKSTSLVFNILRNLSRSKFAISIIAVLILGIGGFLIFSHKNPNYQFVTVKRASITETISVTGNTTPIQNVSLGFENNGTIAHVYGAVGDAAKAGEMLAELNTNDLSAQLRQARANVDAQMAKLEGLKAGAQPEDIATSQAAFDKAQQDLINMYASISDASTDAETKANDAVRTQLNTFFSNPESQNPRPNFNAISSQVTQPVQLKRVTASFTLNKWQNELTNTNSSTEDLNTLLKNSLSYLSTIRDFLNSVSTALNDGTTNLDLATLTTGKSNVIVALNEVNAATKNLNTIAQNIASQKSTVFQAKAQLALKKAGATQQDINTQKAQVEQAQANVASIQAKLQNSKIIAPISGTITQFDAKIGQLAVPNTLLISIIGSGGFEVDAGISETDIGKILIGNKVTMILDAFSNEKFPGTVFYIAPANTNTQGVVSYQIKISFDKPDSRLKSGLTANLIIETKHKDNVLTLPQYAILQNDQGIFIKMLQNNAVQQIPVTLGIQDQNGNVEIVSGVSEEEQVLSIGLKQNQ